VTALHAEDITLVVARLKSHLSSQFDTMELTAVIDADNSFPTTRAAVSTCMDRLTEERGDGDRDVGRS